MIHKAYGYWIHEAGSPDPEPPLSGEHRFDVLIVGGGFTGMWTAWHLAQSDPDLKIGLVEAQRIGHGPSGRNGGFADAMWISFASLVERYGQGPALDLARAAERSVVQIGEFCEEQGVDAWYRLAGYVNVSTAPFQDDGWDKDVEAIRAVGIEDEITVLDAEAMKAICDSPAFRGGVHYRMAATVQPARLGFGIRAALLRSGVSLFEESPVTRIEDRPPGVVATTPGGRIKADRLVLANGPALAGHGSPLRQNVTLASSHMVITEPVPDVVEEIGWTGGEAISDCRSLLNYFRTTPDGRIAFGWGGGRIVAGARRFGRAEVDPEVIAGVIESLRTYFPALADRRIEYAWGGPIDASATHLPHVVSLPSGRAFAAFGYTGNGVGPSQMVGRTLASLVLDRRDGYGTLPFVEPVEALTKVPPEPFRWIGGTVIREAIGRKEDAEMEGRQPDPISATISRIPELIGFHIGR
ncbi:MAG: FAD-dependent oxidoreductase [Solirubrobacterales bacterium]|nr:FAD-dependent oxidoreductase [Solirubrobacterales bacterium]